MARRLVSDDQQMFRVIVVRRQRRDNPQWERGNLASPRFLWDGPEYTSAYGPFPKLGTARGQLTFHTVDAYGNPQHGVVSGHIEQAHTVWTPVGEDAGPIVVTPEFIAEHTRNVRAQAYRDAADDIDAEYPGPGADRAARYAAEYLRRRADAIHPATEEPQ